MTKANICNYIAITIYNYVIMSRRLITKKAFRFFHIFIISHYFIYKIDIKHFFTVVIYGY